MECEELRSLLWNCFCFPFLCSMFVPHDHCVLLPGGVSKLVTGFSSHSSPAHGMGFLCSESGPSRTLSLLEHSFMQLAVPVLPRAFQSCLQKTSSVRMGRTTKLIPVVSKDQGSSSKGSALVLVYSNLCSRAVLFPVQSKDPIAGLLHRKAHEATPTPVPAFCRISSFAAIQSPLLFPLTAS